MQSKFCVWIIPNHVILETVIIYKEMSLVSAVIEKNSLEYLECNIYIQINSYDADMVL